MSASNPGVSILLRPQIYSLITGVYLLGSQGNLYLTPVPSMINSVWLVATGWLISYFVRWK